MLIFFAPFVSFDSFLYVYNVLQQYSPSLPFLVPCDRLHLLTTFLFMDRFTVVIWVTSSKLNTQLLSFPILRLRRVSVLTLHCKRRILRRSPTTSVAYEYKQKYVDNILTNMSIQHIVESRYHLFQLQRLVTVTGMCSLDGNYPQIHSVGTNQAVIHSYPCIQTWQ